MKTLLKTLIVSMIIFLASQVNAQPFMQFGVGATATINEYSKTGFGPSIAATAGYQFNPQDATRILVGLNYNLRELSVSRNQNTSRVTNSKIGLSTGFEVGQKIRMGINFGGLIDTKKSGGTYGNFAGYTEGSMSLTKNDITFGGSVRAERTLKAANYHTETLYGKNVGIWTGQLFARKTFGKKVKSTFKYEPPTNPAPVVPFKKIYEPEEIRDWLLRDSVFGTTISTFVSQRAGLLYEILESRRDTTPRSHNTVFVPTKETSSEEVDPLKIAYKNTYQCFFGSNSTELTNDDKKQLIGMLMNAPETANFVITAYSSSDGNAANNELLATGRAESVMDFLRFGGFSKFKVQLRPNSGKHVNYRRTLIQW